MKSVTVIKDNSTGRAEHYAIHYTVNTPDPELISRIDSAIYRGQCKYFGVTANISEEFRFNITLSSDCIVTMFNIPKRIVDRIANDVANIIGVIPNINSYVYV